jgi:deoxyribodipyrimidine photo-lyase
VTVPTTILWLRRDLRRLDHPALAAAAADGGTVLPLFVLDDILLGASPVRAGVLLEILAATRERYDGALVVRSGPAERVVADLVREVGASSVHVSAESTPHGRRRDQRVREALPEGVPLVATGSPYAVGPGTIRTATGEPYQVFTPFSRAWRRHGWPGPAGEPSGLRFVRRVDVGDIPDLDGRGRDVQGPGRGPGRESGPGEVAVGEAAARGRWAEFREERLTAYADDRDRPDLDGTSRLSTDLKFGTIHPRTLLADIAGRRDKGAQTFVDELAWREFYADVLWHHPGSAWHDLKDTLAGMEYDPDGEASDAVTAWREGRTGYPVVDAGMRQLLAEGWMHNRVRMITASFLTKDLHVWWPHGARFFLEHLRDGDVASNNHGWQWVAGTGTDAAPYFRVFNPVTQGKRFDPDADYVRRWVPELRHLEGAAAHEPWDHEDGYAGGYPERIVDHAAERDEALARYQRARGRGS